MKFLKSTVNLAHTGPRNEMSWGQLSCKAKPRNMAYFSVSPQQILIHKAKCIHIMPKSTMATIVLEGQVMGQKTPPATGEKPILDNFQRKSAEKSRIECIPASSPAQGHSVRESGQECCLRKGIPVVSQTLLRSFSFRGFCSILTGFLSPHS